MAKNGLFDVFATLKKNFALVLSGNGLKRKKRSFLNFCKKPHVKKNFFWLRYGRKRPFLRGPEIFFSENLFFFEKILFAQFSKLSHFEHKNAKKNFFSQIPLYSDPGILP